MRKEKQVDTDRRTKDRPRKGTAASIQIILQSPVLNVVKAPDITSACASSQQRAASVVEERKVFCSAQDAPPPAGFNAPEHNTKSVVKASADQWKLQIAQQVCDAIDAEDDLFEHGEQYLTRKPVKARSATIMALATSEYSSLMAQLDLQISKFSTDELNMPLEEYLKTCPGIKAVKSADGLIQLQKRSSPYPQLEESKRNLQDLLTKAKDGASKGKRSLWFTPCAEPQLPATQSVTSRHVKQDPEEKLLREELNWPEYYMRLQSLGFNAGLAPSLGSQNKFNTPMILEGGLKTGVTPKTLRMPKLGEILLSMNGSPLGQCGKTLPDTRLQVAPPGLHEESQGWLPRDSEGPLTSTRPLQIIANLLTNFGKLPQFYERKVPIDQCARMIQTV